MNDDRDESFRNVTGQAWQVKCSSGSWMTAGHAMLMYERKMAV
ncbi:hypothetical protein [Anoxynatronum buryatiense]|nr:hypothetical protein [Anoxynatronum buryatiense]